MPKAYADDQLAAWAHELNAYSGALDVAMLRAGSAERAARRPRGTEMDTVAELRVGERAARLYRPGAEPLGLVLYLHGGGWTIGSLDTHDRLCRWLADAAGVAVLALDYRLAPEHPWPAAADDTVAALRWLPAHAAELGALNGRVAVAGDSAGGLLATLACLRLRDEDPAALPDLQVLITANTDLVCDQPSMVQNATGGGLDADAVRFFNAQWVPDPDRRSDPAVSPLRANDVSGLPPALIVTAEHDPLRDQGEAYAERLRDAGVDVTLRREPGLVHNFVLLDQVSPSCKAAAERLAADVGERLVARASDASAAG